MSGTPEGGRKAAETNKLKDPDHYIKLGQKGGPLSSGGGFATKKRGLDGLTGPERASEAGRKGGKHGKKV